MNLIGVALLKRRSESITVSVAANLEDRLLLLAISPIMGKSISMMRDEAKTADDKEKKEMEERLQILEKMVHGKLEKAKLEMLVGEKNDQEIHTGTVVAKHIEVQITTSEKESEALKTALHSFFTGDFIGGLEQIVQLGAESVLGNCAMGEYETTDMFIVWSHNALLRCDAYYYRWNFAAKGIIDQAEGVLGVYMTKRVIDLTKTDPQVLTYAISQMADRVLRPPIHESDETDAGKLC
jgi:hypothetical protein